MRTVTLPPRRGPVLDFRAIHGMRVTLSDGRVLIVTNLKAATNGLPNGVHVAEIAVWTGSKWLVVEN